MVAALCAATISCTDLKPLEDDIADLKEQLAQLQGKCESMNESLDALSVVVDAVANRDFVTSVQNTSNSEGQGFTITFVDSPTVTVWIPAQKETPDEVPPVQAPVISVKQGEDGFWYWAADGEYVLDQDGERVPVGTDGVTPQLKSKSAYPAALFEGTYEFAAFWTADEVEGNADMAYYRYMYMKAPHLMIGKGYKGTFGASVRCVRESN